MQRRVPSTPKCASLALSDIPNSSICLQLVDHPLQPLDVDFLGLELFFHEILMLLQRIEDIPNILISNLAHQFYLLALLLAIRRITQGVLQIGTFMDQSKHFIHFFGETLHCSIHFLLELLLFDVCNLVLLLEENDVSPDLLDLYLELLHELLVSFGVVVEFDKLLLLDLILEPGLLGLEVLHHLVAHDVLLTDLHDFLLENFKVLADLSQHVDVVLLFRELLLHVLELNQVDVVVEGAGGEASAWSSNIVPHTS
jgi:hypothetical protein